MNLKKECAFCKTDRIKIVEARTLHYWFECDNCGSYEIGYSLAAYLQERSAYSNGQLWAASVTITDNLEQDPMPKTYWYHKPGESKLNDEQNPIFKRCFDEFEHLPISHSSKPDNILKILGEKLSNQPPFSKVGMTDRDLFRLKIAGMDEAWQWIQELIAAGYITSNAFSQRMKTAVNNVVMWATDINDYFVTPQGWQRIEELHGVNNSKKIFMAMWFGNPNRSEIQGKIESACREAGGWEAFTVDKVEHNNGITDEIIAKINQSKFIIADLTGLNPGVYYEAGYATGRGVPVIYILKDEKKDGEGPKVHFDIQHINQIRWENLDDLKNKLINRIVAMTT